MKIQKLAASLDTPPFIWFMRAIDCGFEGGRGGLRTVLAVADLLSRALGPRCSARHFVLISGDEHGFGI